MLKARKKKQGCPHKEGGKGGRKGGRKGEKQVEVNWLQHSKDN